MFFLWWSSLVGICEGIRVELIVRDEALGFVKDELLRNHVSGTVLIDQERKLERESVKRPHHVNFARQGKLWWRLVATLTRKLFDKFGFLRRKTNRTI